MDKMPGAAVDPLVMGKVIGDVVDMFVPLAELVVRYGGATQIASGLEIKPLLAVEKPTVHLTPSSSNYYTLVMVDPDAPNPDEPTYREYLHWLVINIPAGSDVSQGEEVMAYMGPQPPAGIHRYVFAAFEQQHGRMETERAKPAKRPHFSTRRFSAENQLGLPAAVLYFKAQM